MRRRQVWIGLIGLSGLVSAGAGLSAILFLDWLGTEAGNRWATHQAARLASEQLNEGSIQIGALQTDFYSEFSIQDLRVLDGYGQEILTLKQVDVELDPQALRTEQLRLSTVTIDEVHLNAELDQVGQLNLLRILPESDDSEDSVLTRMLEDWTIGADAVLFTDATLQFEDHRLDAALPVLEVQANHLGLSLKYDESGTQIRDLSVDLDVQEPLAEHLEIRGTVSTQGSTLSVDSLELNVADVALIANGSVSWGFEELYTFFELERLSVGPAGLAQWFGMDLLHHTVELQGQIEGRPSDVDASFTVLLPEGSLELSLGADVSSSTPAWELRSQIQDVDWAAVTPLLPVELVFSGSVSAKGQGYEPFSDLTSTASVHLNDIDFAGEKVTSLEVEIEVVDSQLGTSGKVVHPLGDADWQSQINMDSWQLEADVRGVLPDLAELAEIVEMEGVPPLVGQAEFNGEIRTDLLEEALSVEIDGQLALVDLLVEGAQFDRLTAPVQGSVSLESVLLHGRLNIEHFSRDELVVQEVHSPNWHASWDLQNGLSVDADFELDQVSLGADAVRIGSVDGHLAGGLDAAQQLTADATVLVSDVVLGPGGYRAEGGEVTAALAGDDVRLEFDLARRERPFFQGVVEGSLFSQKWLASNVVFAPTSDRPMRSMRPIHLRLADGGVRDVDLAMSGPGGSVVVKGDWLEIHTGATDMSLDIRGLELPFVVDVIRLYDSELVDFLKPGDVAGSLDLTAKAIDGDSGMAVESMVNVTGLRWQEQLRLPELSIQVDGLLESPTFHFQATDELGPLLEMVGVIPLKGGVASLWLDCDGEVEFNGRLHLSDKERFESLSPSLELPSGRIGGQIKIWGEACDPHMELLSSGDVLLGQNQGRVRYDLDVSREGSEIRFASIFEEGLTPRLKVEGTIHTGISRVLGWALNGDEAPDLGSVHTWVDEIQVDVSPLDFRLESLDSFFSMPAGVAGRLSGNMAVSGDPMSPSLQADLVLVDGRIGGASVEEASFVLAPKTDGYDVSSYLRLRSTVEAMQSGQQNKGVHEVRLAGHIPFSIDLERGLEQDLAREGLDLKVSGDGLPLAMLVGVVEDVTEATGRLVLEGSVKGTLLNPNPRMYIKLQDASLAYSVTGVRYPKIELMAEIRNRNVFIYSLDVDSEPMWSRLQPRPGSVHVAGQATLVGLDLDKVSITAEADGFWLSHIPMATLKVNGKIDITGKTPGLKIRGAGVLEEGLINFDESWFTEDKDLMLDQAIALNRSEQPVLGVEIQDLAPEFWEAFDVEVSMDVDRKLKLHADIPMEYAMGQQLAALSTIGVKFKLDGQDVKVIWRDGEPNMVGTVEVFDGEMFLLGRQFKVGAGEVSWVGGDFLDPLLDLTASKDTRGYGEVTASLGGSLENMKVGFQSDEYPDQTDILSILMLGKPASELAGSESQVGAQMLGAALAMAAGRQFSRAVGTTFMGQIELDQDALRVGFPLGEKAFIELQRRSMAEPNENALELRLEWLIMQRMYMEVVSGDGGQGSANVYRRWRF